MKMIRAIVRPEAADIVSEGLAEAGFYSMTKMPVFGRGKQKGLTVGSLHYDELPKVLIIIVVEDEAADEAVKIIQFKAYTGNEGDGKIFTSPVEKVFTVRTGSNEL
ncbi:MAG: P-II family nitrogen regulator [Candidatus Symbiothrix sp.]|jgi:nitrogen regulatory protein PII 1|nr:P-II family nitrogen regulator [Candidatus Symbiothrix sp.]